MWRGEGRDVSSDEMGRGRRWLDVCEDVCLAWITADEGVDRGGGIMAIVLVRWFCWC